MCRVVGILASRFAAGRSMMSIMSVLVAVVALIAAEDRVEASCGDWLAGHQRSAGDAESLGAEREAMGPVTPRPGDAPRLPQCDGPNCRGVPFLPALPREVSLDAPSYDPADRAAVAALGRADIGRSMPAGDDRKPLSVVAAVPIRPPRRASLQA